MAKGIQAQAQPTPAAELTGSSVSVEKKRNGFMEELAALTYYQVQGTKTPFESLPEAEKDTWAKMSGAVLVSLDKMNKMVAPKVTVEDAEARRNKNHGILTAIIRKFVEGIQTLRCPKCGSSAQTRAQLFPCEELAFRILDGDVKQ